MLPILKFNPIFKSVLWGGTRIAEFKGLPSQGDNVGESWELSPMAGHESVVADGPYAGKTLPEMLREHGREIMGEKLYERYGDKFPLLDLQVDVFQRCEAVWISLIHIFEFNHAATLFFLRI